MVHTMALMKKRVWALLCVVVLFGWISNNRKILFGGNALIQYLPKELAEKAAVAEELRERSDLLWPKESLKEKDSTFLPSLGSQGLPSVQPGAVIQTDSDAVLPLDNTKTVVRYRDIIPANEAHSHHLSAGNGIVCSNSTLQSSRQNNATATFVLMSLREAPQHTQQPLSWLWHCIQQIRLTNPRGRIILLQDTDHRWNLTEMAAHEFGLQVCETNVPEISKAIGQDYRFHYLPFLMKKLDLVDVWHLEYDNMIYADFAPLTATASRLYRELAATPIGFVKGVYYMTAGMIFIKDHIAAEALRLLDNEYIQERKGYKYNENANDMVDLGYIQLRKGRDFLGSLPVLPFGHHTSSFVKHFGSVFDGASYGQYLDGVGRAAPLGKHDKPGWATWTHFGGAALIRGKIKMSWEKNSRNLWVPYVEDTQSKKLYPLNNLHVYSKHLKEYLSDQESMPPVPSVVQEHDKPAKDISIVEA